MGRRWVCGHLAVLTHQLAQPISVRLHIPEIRVPFVTSDMLQLIGRIAVIFPQKAPG